MAQSSRCLLVSPYLPWCMALSVTWTSWNTVEASSPSITSCDSAALEESRPRMIAPWMYTSHVSCPSRISIGGAPG
eukprot:scaffold738_cov349-Prasinococcus_capsulatus_cf.AAC.1